jgi:3-oxoacyl-[acyl-carrier-protein] synthase II
VSDLQANRKRVVITGMGLVTCLGSRLDTFWDALISGKSGVKKITSIDVSGLPCQIAGEITDFDPADYLPAKEARRMSRASHVAMAAAMNAVEDSKLPNPYHSPERLGVYFGTGIGGFDRAVEALEIFREQGLAKVNPFSMPSVLLNMPAFYVTKEFNALGPNITVTTACATGSQVIGEAAQAIRNNWADVVIAGGTEAMIQDFLLGGFSLMRAIPTNYNDDPERASRPFDALREGFVFSEGSGCVVLEEMEHAVNRGARIYAEVAGYASSNDAYHLAAPHPEAEGAIRTMKNAILDAGIAPDAIGYINAHGTSTVLNDLTETIAIKKLFGEKAYEIPISSTKSMMGHAMGASGAIEAIATVMTIVENVIHPTINYEHPDPELDLDYVPNTKRETRVDTALSNSFGLGGQNACLVFRRVD